MKEFVIRSARAGDERALARLMLTLWPDEGRAAFAKKSVKALRLHVNGGPRGVLLAAVSDDGDVIGFVSAGVRKWSEAGGPSPIPHVEGWFVDEAWRRRGVGRALLAAVETWAKAKGFTHVSSDTWAHNQLSVDAHERSGYRVTERIVYFLKKL